MSKWLKNLKWCTFIHALRTFQAGLLGWHTCMLMYAIKIHWVGEKFQLLNNDSEIFFSFLTSLKPSLEGVWRVFLVTDKKYRLNRKASAIFHHKCFSFSYTLWMLILTNDPYSHTHTQRITIVTALFFITWNIVVWTAKVFKFFSSLSSFTVVRLSCGYLCLFICSRGFAEQLKKSFRRKRKLLFEFWELPINFMTQNDSLERMRVVLSEIYGKKILAGKIQTKSSAGESR